MRSLLGIVVVFLFCGCVLTNTSAVPPVKIAKPMRAPVASNGSLWSASNDGAFADFKARRWGDALTVAIYEKASASKEASTSTERDSTASVGLTNLFGLEEYAEKINENMDASSIVNTDYKNKFKGKGSTTRKEDLVATLTARVVEVLPNGNLKIAGSKVVTVNREDQLINLTGEVRPVDISSGNIIDSKYILDARISYTGKGVISDKMGQGWLVGLMDAVWPF